jgi:hypothetical protein
MNELCDRVQGSTVFTKLEIKSGYILVRIKAGEKWKTPFKTCYGHYADLVILFRLTNAQAMFQDMMSEILRDLIDQGVVVHIDDILIYTQTMEEHILLVKEVLNRLHKWNLTASMEKYEFYKDSVQFRGYIIS